MKRILFLALLTTAGAAWAAVPQAGTPAPAAPAVAQAPTPTHFPGVSEAGNAVLAKAQSTPDPQQQAIARQYKAAHDQLLAAVMAPVIDVDKVAAALRAEEAAQAQARTHNTDRLIAVLKQLPDDDKGTFLRTLVLSRQARPAGAPTQPRSNPQP